MPRHLSQLLTREREGEREHPLAPEHVGQDVVHQMGGGLGHEASATGRTEAPALAREGHRPLEASRGAAHAQEAVSPEATLEEASQLACHEAREANPLVLEALEEPREVLESALRWFELEGRSPSHLVGFGGKIRA